MRWPTDVDRGPMSLKCVNYPVSPVFPMAPPGPSWHLRTMALG